MSLLVVDGPEGESTVEKALHMEAKKTILGGAAVFFPDKHVRREKLFHMMVSIESLQVTLNLPRTNKDFCSEPNDIMQ